MFLSNFAYSMKISGSRSARKGDMKRLLLAPLLLALSSPVISAEVEVKEQAPYSYDDETVNNIRVRGKYGRYLQFIGRSKNTYRSYSDPGSPGTVNCTTTGYSTNCTTTGYRAPSYSPGGTQSKNFIYQLDCQDLTFNREGDKASAGGAYKGWMPISNDPVAEAVANKYCPKIDSLQKIWKSGREYFKVIGNESLPLNNRGKSFKLVNQGLKKRNKGDYKGAIIDFTKSIEINPFYSAPYDWRAGIKEDLKDYDGAILDYKKALELKPSTFGYDDLAWLQRKNKDYEGAINSYTKAIELDDGKYPIPLSKAYVGRGFSKKELGRLYEACQDFKKAVELESRTEDWFEIFRCKDY